MNENTIARWLNFEGVTVGLPSVVGASPTPGAISTYCVTYDGATRALMLGAEHADITIHDDLDDEAEAVELIHDAIAANAERAQRLLPDLYATLVGAEHLSNSPAPAGVVIRIPEDVAGPHGASTGFIILDDLRSKIADARRAMDLAYRFDATALPQTVAEIFEQIESWNSANPEAPVFEDDPDY